MTQSQCRRSVGDKFWPGVVVENKKKSLNNRSNNPNKSGAVTLSEIFNGFWTGFVGKSRDEPPMASDCIGGDWRRHLWASFLSLKGGFSDLHMYHSPLQQERLKLLAILSEAPLYTRRWTTIPPYDSSETITESVWVVAGRLRFSRRSPETTRRHWISTWVCNFTQNLATSLRLFGGRLRIVGHLRLCYGMLKMSENLASNRTI